MLAFSMGAWLLWLCLMVSAAVYGARVVIQPLWSLSTALAPAVHLYSPGCGEVLCGESSSCVGQGSSKGRVLPRAPRESNQNDDGQQELILLNSRELNLCAHDGEAAKPWEDQLSTMHVTYAGCRPCYILAMQRNTCLSLWSPWVTL